MGWDKSQICEYLGEKMLTIDDTNYHASVAPEKHIIIEHLLCARHNILGCRDEEGTLSLSSKY